MVDVTPIVAWAMEIDGIGSTLVEYRVWSGEGQLSLNSETWEGVSGANGAAVQLSAYTAQIGQPRQRTQVQVAVPPAAIRDMLAFDSGPRGIRVHYIYSTDAGRTWEEAPISIAGQVSRPQYEDGLYTVEIETWGGDADRGEPKFWSDETQKAEHSGDKGFEFARQIAQGLEVKWPP